MEQIVSYLEKLGYTVEEQGKGKIEKYLVVFKDGSPVGFILPDLTVKLVSGAGEQNNIKTIIDFINQNQGLTPVGASELLVATYKGSQLTTFFDVKAMQAAYVIYIRENSSGEVKRTKYSDFDTAVYFFLTQTQMVDLTKFTAQRESFGDRLLTKSINYLLSKKKERAEQR